ncbi:MAG: transketolase family protein [Bacteroidota bacterium]
MNEATMIATRQAYGDALVDLGGRDPRLVALDADVAKSISSNKFHKAFPERAFNLGIAEQNMFGFAAGLASTGRTVFASTYAVFASMRACEQIRTFIAYTRLNVKIGASHGGLHTGMDGVTHQAIEDIGIMRSIPGITILHPADAVMAYKATIAAAAYPGPVYLRLTRNPIPVIHQRDQAFEIGKAIKLREGRQVGFVAAGVMVHRALQAADLLQKQGIDAAVLDMHTIRPLDREALIQVARTTGAIVAAEDHNINGGLCSAVCECLAEECPVPLERIGLRDVFGESGEPDVLMEAYGMGVSALVRAAEVVVERKARGGGCVPAK